MNALELLTKQHRELETALKSLLKVGEDERGGLFRRAGDALMAHVSVEEEQFYPAVKAQRTEDILLESLEEHLSLKRVLADLVALSPTDPHFEPKCHVLKEQLEHHHKEEEENLFPKVKTLLGAEQLEALGASMAAAQATLLTGKPRELVTAQTGAATEL